MIKTTIAGKQLQPRAAEALAKVISYTPISPMQRGEVLHWSEVTEPMLRALPRYASKLWLRRLRGIGPTTLSEITAFLEGFGIVLPDALPGDDGFPRRTASYFEGPPNVHGVYWWRAEPGAEAELRVVTAETPVVEIVAGWWHGPLFPPPFA